MALPTTVPAAPFGIGADEDARKEYNEALQKTLSALEARAGQGPNLWNIAGQFLNPGRTGSFGEAVGRAATSAGQDIEKQQEMAVPIAQMRASIAAQKYDTAQQAEAMKMLANAVGSTPADLQQNLANGTVPPGMGRKITPELYASIAARNPKVGAIAKDMATMETDQTKILVDIVKSNLSLAEAEAKYGSDFIDLLPPQARAILQRNENKNQKPVTKPATEPTVEPLKPAEVTTPDTPQKREIRSLSVNDIVPNGKIISTYGMRRDPFGSGEMKNHPAWDITAKPGASVIAPVPGKVIFAGESPGFGNYIELQHPNGDVTAYGHLSGINVKKGDDVKASQEIGASGATGKTTGPHLHFGVKREGAWVDPASFFAQQSASLPAQITPIKPMQVAAAPQTTTIDTNDLRGMPLAAQAEIRKERIKESEKSYLPKIDAVLQADPSNTGQTINLTNELVAIARRSPTIFGQLQASGWINAALAAAQEGVQTPRGSISIPVEKFIEVKNLNKTQRQELTRATQIFGTLFLNNMKTYGKLLGTNATDNDARLYAAPMAKPSDAAASITYWGQHNVLNAITAGKMYDAYGDYMKTQPKGSDPGSFFMEKNSPYRSIINDYNRYYNQLSTEYAPGTGKR